MANAPNVAPSSVFGISDEAHLTKKTKTNTSPMKSIKIQNTFKYFEIDHAWGNCASCFCISWLDISDW